MKCLIYSVLLFTCLNSYAQQIRNFKIPLVKESRHIDSLIDEFILFSIPKRSCISIYIRKPRDDHFYQITSRKTNTKLIDDEVLFITENLRFFNYCGYTVFVYGDLGASELFTKTSYLKQFKFIKIPKKNDIDEVLKNVLGWGTFEYKNGKFVKITWVWGDKSTPPQ